MIYQYIIEPNTVKIIRSNWDNDTIVVVNLINRDNAKLFWASDNEISNHNVSQNFEIQLGESIYLVAEGRNNLVILNQNGDPQHVCVDVVVNPIPPSIRPISATSGF